MKTLFAVILLGLSMNACYSTTQGNGEIKADRRPQNENIFLADIEQMPSNVSDVGMCVTAIAFTSPEDLLERRIPIKSQWVNLQEGRNLIGRTIARNADFTVFQNVSLVLGNECGELGSLRYRIEDHLVGIRTEIQLPFELRHPENAQALLADAKLHRTVFHFDFAPLIDWMALSSSAEAWRAFLEESVESRGFAGMASWTRI